MLCHAKAHMQTFIPGHVLLLANRKFVIELMMHIGPDQQNGTSIRL